MIDFVGNLIEFHTKYGHLISDKVRVPSISDVILRRRLIREEANELDSALSSGDLVEIADGLADLLYVTFGTAITYGIPIKAVFNEVHRSNMTKSTEKDEFGKTLKGDYSPAKIKEILSGEWY